MSDIEAYNKIVQCEVAREAINSRFRDYLFLEDEARGRGDSEAAQAAFDASMQLIQLRDTLTVEDSERNQRISTGDFSPPAPQVPKETEEAMREEMAFDNSIRYEVALEVLGQSLQPFINILYGNERQETNPKLLEYCQKINLAISDLQDTLDSDDTDIIDLILDSQNKLFRF